ncbi:MAG: ABC transporter ATP-binding protein [Lachnotalea sp.]
MSTLELKNINKIYENGVAAVRDFNLEVKDKEFIIFVGPSGCGKSTTLRMIAGLEEISEGELWIDNSLVNYVETKDRDLAMVFQNYALYPYMTVYENLAFSLRVRKLPKKEIDEKVRKTAKILQIEELLFRKPKALSGGQKQRVAIGSAIVREPKLFLMDEPLSNLDAKLRAQMRVEIAKLHKELSTTIIYVTHDQTEAMTLGTKIVVMKDGIVQQIAQPKDLYENPINKFVAGFIGAPAMNFIDAVVRVRYRELYLEVLDQEIQINDFLSREFYAKGYVNEKIVIGIRPEDISFLTKEEQDVSQDSIITVVPDLRELLGAEANIYFKLANKTFCAVVPADNNIKLNEPTQLVMKQNKMLFFDVTTEENIFSIQKNKNFA